MEIDAASRLSEEVPILKAQACPETLGFGICNLEALLRQPRIRQGPTEKAERAATDDRRTPLLES